MKKYIIIYHNEDNDGVVSAALFYHYLISEMLINENEIYLLGAGYNDLNKLSVNKSPKDLHKEYENLIMTDISFNEKYMKSLYDEFGKNMIWCDHHKPIIEASRKLNFGNMNGVRDITKSAILCVYEYLYDQFNERYSKIDISKNGEYQNFPELLRILSAYDSWSYFREGYNFEFVRYINKGFTHMYKLDIKCVINLMTHFLDPLKEEYIINELYDKGEVLCNYDDQQFENIIKISGDSSWTLKTNDNEYRKCCVIFHQGATSSTCFHSLRNTDIQNGIIFKHSPSGSWTISIYNINNDDSFDCGQIMKDKYNGGGHKGAAGCTISQEQFIKILQSKEL